MKNVRLLCIILLIISVLGTNAFANNEISYSSYALQNLNIVNNISEIWNNSVTYADARIVLLRLFNKEKSISDNSVLKFDKNKNDKKINLAEFSVLLLKASDYIDNDFINNGDEALLKAKKIGYLNGISETDEFNYNIFCSVILNSLLIPINGDNISLIERIMTENIDITNVFEISEYQHNDNETVKGTEILKEHHEYYDTKFEYFNKNDEYSIFEDTTYINDEFKENIQKDEKKITEDLVSKYKFYWQNNLNFNLPKGEGCYITSMAMALKTLGHDVTPYDVYTANGDSVYADYLKIATYFNVQIEVINSPTLDDLKKSFSENPYGTVVTFLKDGFSHAIYVTNFDDVLICNDPAYEAGEQLDFDETWVYKNGVSTDFMKSIILIKNKI